jgi:hypothetical protein
MERYHNGREVIDRWDRVFRVLSAEPRRQVVVSLLDTAEGEWVSLPEAAVNPNVPVAADDLRRDLVHSHLPLLSEYDFVEWESAPLRVSHGTRFPEVGVVIDSLHGAATEIPDSLVVGCQRLEAEQEFDS